jgi:hypothetical protein
MLMCWRSQQPDLTLGSETRKFLLARGEWDAERGGRPDEQANHLSDYLSSLCGFGITMVRGSETDSNEFDSVDRIR